MSKKQERGVVGKSTIYPLPPGVKKLRDKFYNFGESKARDSQVSRVKRRQFSPEKGSNGRKNSALFVEAPS